MENPIKMDDLGVPLFFFETPISSCLINDFEKNALNLDPRKVEESSSRSRGSLIDTRLPTFKHVKRQCI